MPISIEDYVGPWAGSIDWTVERQANAARLLSVINPLEEEMTRDYGILFLTNPKTKTQVSGETLGGFRPQSAPVGAPHSAHKEGLAVDRYDPNGMIDEWMMNHQDRLAELGVHIEHPSTTPGWSHWTIRAPGSGLPVFYP